MMPNSLHNNRNEIKEYRCFEAVNGGISSFIASKQLHILDFYLDSIVLISE